MSVFDGIGLNAQTQGTENRLVNRALSKLPEPYISGLKLKADISLGNLILNTIDSSGVVWVCTDIQGWWQQPDPEFPEFTRGWGDGSYDARGRWAARDMVLTGSFFPQDPAQVAAARDALVAATNLVYLGNWLVVRETKSVNITAASAELNTITAPAHGLSVNSPVVYQSIGAPIGGLIPERIYYVRTAPNANTVTLSTAVGGTTLDIADFFKEASTHSFSVPNPKTSYVRISGRPEINTVSARGRTDFSIGLRAADPIKYELVGSNAEDGNVVTITTSGTIVNKGNVRVPVLIRVSGAATSNAKITNTTTTPHREINFVQAKSTGSILEIDTYNREVLLDTAGTVTNGRQFIETLADWIFLEPGPNTFTASGATFQVEYRSGWIG